ncbi:MAG: hypothetical protein D3909_10545 [Candidatus Electrothrix sp. ATG1]|nr:hypothetical protein [Candidatus Electrothrix sp. ATG1]MCI5207228.1 hypothetical protein [Candidatus Electrothrix sp. ATG2]
MEKTNNKKYFILLEFLLQQVGVAYQDCSNDRKKIHDIEWEEDDKPSVLGEVEVFSDFIIGHVTSIINCNEKMSKNDRAEIICALKTRSIFGSSPISEWIAYEAAKYSGYYNYLQSIEILRVATITG